MTSIPRRFTHVARWDAEHEWIEMLLRSEVDQRVRISDLELEVEFAAGEEMRTEISDKFRREGFEAELRDGRLRPRPLVGGPGRRLRPLAVVLGGEPVTRVVILGGGSAGEAFVGALSRLEGDFEMTLVERALVGGECTYWACMPSKTLLRAPELLAAARQAPGAAEAITGALDIERVFWWRDQVVEGYEDEGHGEWLADRGTELVRGDATVSAPGVLDVGGQELPYDKLVVATGSRPALPPIEGIHDVPHWTTANATASSVVPGSLVVVGGGASGVELAQLYQRLGSNVTIVQRSRLLTRMDEEAAALLQERLEEDGVRVRCGSGVARVDVSDPGVTVSLDDGETIACERLLVAVGRTPTVDGLGLEQIGVEIGKQGIVVDEYLAAAENVWAIGDVTGVSLFTHVAQVPGARRRVERRRDAAGRPTTAPSRRWCSPIPRWPRWARSRATASSTPRGR